jgi:hypothetical protein
LAYFSIQITYNYFYDSFWAFIINLIQIIIKDIFLPFALFLCWVMYTNKTIVKKIVPIFLIYTLYEILL